MELSDTRFATDTTGVTGAAGAAGATGALAASVQRMHDETCLQYLGDEVEVAILDTELEHPPVIVLHEADRLEQPSAASKGGDLGRRGWGCHGVEVG